MFPEWGEDSTAFFPFCWGRKKEACRQKRLGHGHSANQRPWSPDPEFAGLEFAGLVTMMHKGVFCLGLVSPWVRYTLCRWLGRQRELWPWVQFASPHTSWSQFSLDAQGGFQSLWGYVAACLGKGLWFLRDKGSCLSSVPSMSVTSGKHLTFLNLSALTYKMRRLISSLPCCCGDSIR